MMTRITNFLIAACCMISMSATAQLDSILQPYYGTLVSGYKYKIINFEPDTVRPGDIYAMYQQLYGPDSINTLKLVAAGPGAKKYTQYYDTIEVEPGGIMELFDKDDGYMYMANGQVVTGLEIPDSCCVDATTAFRAVLNHHPNTLFAWEDPAWEAAIKAELNDSTATYYPKGELVFTFEDHILPDKMLISPKECRLAWRFEYVVGLDPYFNNDYYVDAITGELHKVYTNVHTEDPVGVQNTSQTTTGHAVYPNPVEDYVNVRLEKNGKYKLQLLSSRGKVVLSEQVIGDKGQLDVSGLGSGVYFLQVYQDGYVEALKIIKR